MALCCLLLGPYRERAPLEEELLLAAVVPVPVGIGWTADTVQRRGSQVVDALHPAGTGIIEYEVSSRSCTRAAAHAASQQHAPPAAAHMVAAIDETCIHTGSSCHCKDRHHRQDTLICPHSESMPFCSRGAALFVTPTMSRLFCCPQDIALMAEIPESDWEPDSGKASLSKVLGVQDLDASPLNMSLVASNKVLLRGYFLNCSNITNGIAGMESFQDVVLRCVLLLLLLSAPHLWLLTEAPYSLGCCLTAAAASTCLVHSAQPSLTC